MSLLARIFSRMAFLRVEFSQDGSLCTELFEWSADKCVRGEWQAAKGILTAVVVCGHGVVTKADDAEIIARVKADGQTFLWSSSDGQTSFVRRDRLSALEAELATRNLVAVRIFCTDAAVDFGQAANGFAAQLRDGLRWKWLLRPTVESSAAARVLVNRIKLPLLGAFLSLLAANALLAPRLNSRRQVLQTQIAVREQSASNAASAGARQRELFAQFATAPTVPHAVLCDRIASAVSERVVLTLLQVEPLTKRVEIGKPLERRAGVALVAGTAPAAADISEFVQRLSAEACCREVLLKSVEKQREGELLAFELEIRL